MGDLVFSIIYVLIALHVVMMVLCFITMRKIKNFKTTFNKGKVVKLEQTRFTATFPNEASNNQLKFKKQDDTSGIFCLLNRPFSFKTGGVGMILGTINFGSGIATIELRRHPIFYYAAVPFAGLY